MYILYIFRIHALSIADTVSFGKPDAGGDLHRMTPRAVLSLAELHKPLDKKPTTLYTEYGTPCKIRRGGKGVSDGYCRFINRLVYVRTSDRLGHEDVG